MPTIVVFAGTNDGHLDSGTSLTYATAADGTSIAVVNVSYLTFGQINALGNYSCYEAFVSFDCTAIGPFAHITAAVFQASGASDFTDTNFTMQARGYDWGTTVTSADWRTRAQDNALTIRTSLSSASYSGGYMTFTNAAALSGGVDALTEYIESTIAANNTRFLLSSSRHASGTAPPNNEYLAVDSADAAGDTSDPKITITWAQPARTLMLI